MLLKFVLLAIVVLTEFFHGTSTLVTIDGSSVCHEAYSVLESRYVSYRESYRTRFSILFKTKWRVNYRLEYDTVYKTREVCCSGYEDVGSICLKMCSTGYRLDLTKILCQPICDFICENGRCTSPNTCSCDNGYEKSTTEPNVCVPVCDRLCVNADCVAPDQCQCHGGYSKTDDDFFCAPQCTDGCVQGTCTAPDICTCDKSYERNAVLKYVCDPVCQETCVLGMCVAPDTCTCLDAHRQISSTECAPLCDNGCINGECIEPNVCRCNEGYLANPPSSGICEPVCTKQCEHGLCIGPDTCLCNVGFKLNETEWNVCDPLCSESCVNALCAAPETCICLEGYRKSTSDNACLAVCKAKCVNGNCVAPETCACDAGYRKTGIANICEPVCENCTNGNCTEPNVCTCFEGYENESNATCVPSCNCINGTCIAPDTCQCHRGFSFANGNASLCLPECNAGCTNGKCIEPDVCSCNEGFVKLNDSSDGICVEACQNGSCQHGDCQSDRYCQCYFGWTGAACDTPTMCVLMLKEDAGFRDVNGEGENDAMLESPWNGPMCDDGCLENINNETLCYNYTTHEVPRVACFLIPDSTCKFLDPSAENLLRNTTVIGVGGAIIILILGATVGFIIFLKYKKKKANDISVIINRDSLNTLLQEDSDDEPLQETIN